MDPNTKPSPATASPAARNGTLTFPQIVRTLIDAGFDRNLVDLRLGQGT